MRIIFYTPAGRQTHTHTHHYFTVFVQDRIHPRAPHHNFNLHTCTPHPHTTISTSVLWCLGPHKYSQTSYTHTHMQTQVPFTMSELLSQRQTFHVVPWLRLAAEPDRPEFQRPDPEIWGLSDRPCRCEPNLDSRRSPRSAQRKESDKSFR